MPPVLPPYFCGLCPPVHIHCQQSKHVLIVVVIRE